MVGFGFSMVAVRPLSRELLLDCIKELSIQDRWLLARQNFALVFDLADIEPIAQEIEQRSALEQNAAADSTGCEQPFLCSDILISEVAHHRVHPTEFEIASVDQPDPFGLVFDDGDLAVLHLVSKGQGTADPKPFSFGGGNLVADALGGD